MVERRGDRDWTERFRRSAARPMPRAVPVGRTPGALEPGPGTNDDPETGGRERERTNK